MHDQHALLPTSGSALGAEPRLAEAVRRISASHGMDYRDDAAVGQLLREQQAIIHRAKGGALVWLGVLTFLAGTIWPILVWLEVWGRPRLATPKDYAVTFGPPAALLVLGCALLVVAHRESVRRLRHPALEGYRLVLAAAKAHGVAVTHVPGWLVGRGEYGGHESAPLPGYDPPAETPAPGAAPRAAAESAPGGTAPVPQKPAAVAEYERIADHGGWHDEGGLILIIVGCVGVAWGYTQDEPGAYLAVILVGLGIWAWLAGSRLGERKRELREHAGVYVRQLISAQSAGAVVPELSPPLRELVE